MPVRIELDPAEVAAHPLRVGLSTTVDVETSDRRGALNATEPLPGATLSTPVFDGQLAAAQAQADAIVDEIESRMGVGFDRLALSGGDV